MNKNKKIIGFKNLNDENREYDMLDGYKISITREESK